MVKRVFYIEKEKFLRQMVEFALKAKGVEVYTVDSLKDNFYLIDDLAPHLVIFGLTETPEDLEKLYSYREKTKLCLFATEEDSKTRDSRIHATLKKPLEGAALAERILALVD